MSKQTAFFISDGTGITAESLGHSLLSRFSGLHVERVTLPYINTELRAKQAAANNKNGVVGNTGKTIPITPSTTLRQPMVTKKPLTTTHATYLFKIRNN